MALRLRRGTNAERLLVTPVEGELVYTTDTKLIFAEISVFLCEIGQKIMQKCTKFYAKITRKYQTDSAKFMSDLLV